MQIFGVAQTSKLTALVSAIAQATPAPQSPDRTNGQVTNVSVSIEIPSSEGLVKTRAVAVLVFGKAEV